MQPPTFLYYLFGKNKRPYFKDKATGAILEGNDDYFKKAGGEQANLDFSPEGWKDSLVKYARNNKYGGVFRDFTQPMTFPKDGAAILNYLMWQGGIQAVCYIGIMKLNRLSTTRNYEPWYFSEINFVAYKENATSVTVGAIEGGPSKYLKAFENTVYDIPLTSDLQTSHVLMDGMELSNTATWFINSGEGTGSALLGNHLADLNLIQKEIDDIGGVFDVARTKVNSNTANIKATGAFGLKVTTPGTIKVEWDFTLTAVYYANLGSGLNPAARLLSQVKVLDKTGIINGSQDIIDLKPSTTQVVGTFLCKGQATLVVNEGDEMFVHTYLTVEGLGGDVQTEITYGGNNLFKVSYTFKHTASTVECHTAFRLGELLCLKMSEGKYGLRSTFLKNLNDIVLTSGDALRGNTPAVIKTSWDQYFKSFAARYGLRLGIEGDLFVVEQHEYFFQNVVIADLGEVQDLELEVAEDLMLNTIKTGYNKQEYNGLNAKAEVNQGQQWTTTITKIKNELDLVSPYRADSFGAELLRINFGKLKSTDSRSDNDTWFISVAPDIAIFNLPVSFDPLLGLVITSTIPLYPNQVVRIDGSQFNNGTFTVINVSGFIFFQSVNIVGAPIISEGNVNITIQILSGIRYKLKRPAYTSIKGLINPLTAFNVELRPKASILANGALIHSSLDLMDSEDISFQSADMNADLETTLNGVTLIERAPIKVADLPVKLFRPYYINFRTKVGINVHAILKTNPYGKIKISWRSNPYYVFLDDGGVKDATLDEQNWKTRSAPENDLSKLNGKFF